MHSREFAKRILKHKAGRIDAAGFCMPLCAKSKEVFLYHLKVNREENAMSKKK